VSEAGRGATGEAALRARLAQLEAEAAQLRGRLQRLEGLAGGPFPALELFAGGGCFAVALQAVAEVVPVPACDEVPGAPDWLLGTFLLGRTLVPVVDLGRRLRGGPPSRSLADQVVVVRGAGVAGLRVAGVGEVVELDPATFLPAPEASEPALVGTLRSARGAPVQLLSAAELARTGAASRGEGA